MNVDDETIPPPPPPPPPSSPPPPPFRRLTRSTEDKVLTGLCGGLGRALGVDPVVFRIAFVVLALAGGTGILLYLVGWLLVPDDRGVTEADRLLHERHHNVALAVLVVVGVLLLFDRASDHRGGDVPLALVLIGVGAAILWSRQNRPGPGAAGGTGGTGGSPGSGSVTPPPPTAGPVTDAPPPPAAAPADSVPPPPPSAPPSDAVPPPAAAPPPNRPDEPRSVLVLATLSVALVVAGILALLGVSLVAGLALVLLVTGVALVVGAWRGRARLLIPVALLLTAALATASFIDVPVRGGVGDRAYRPLTLAQLRSPYRLGVGDLQLDLSDLDLTGRSTQVLVTAGLGHVEVVVPESVQVVVIGHAGLGEVDVFGSSWEGTGINRRVVAGGREGAGRLTVRARVGIGQVEVFRAAA